MSRRSRAFWRSFSSRVRQFGFQLLDSLVPLLDRLVQLRRVRLQPFDLRFELLDSLLLGREFADRVFGFLLFGFRVVREVPEDALDALVVRHDAGGDFPSAHSRRHLSGDSLELVLVAVEGEERRGHRVALVVVVVPVLPRPVLLFVHRQVALGRPPGGVETPAELLHGLRHRRHVRRDDDGPSALDYPLDDVGGVGGSRTQHVEEGTVQIGHRDGRRGAGVDADDDVVAALGEGFELDTVAAESFDFDPSVAGAAGRNGNVARAGLHVERRVGVAAVLLRHFALVVESGAPQFGFDLPGVFFHRAVNPAGVAVGAPPAFSGRTPPRDFDARRIGKGGHFLSDVHRGEAGRGLRFAHRFLTVGNAVARCDPREGFGSFSARHLYETGFVRQASEEVDEGVLVGGEFVHVVRRDERRFVAFDEPPKLAVRDDVAVHLLAVVDDQCVRGRIAPNVPALDIDTENEGVKGTRALAHGSWYGPSKYKSGADGSVSRGGTPSTQDRRSPPRSRHSSSATPT